MREEAQAPEGRAQRGAAERTASEARSEAKPSGGGGSGCARAGTPRRGGSGLCPEPDPHYAARPVTVWNRIRAQVSTRCSRVAPEGSSSRW